MGRKFNAVVFSLGCLQASSALALGLGELKLESFLNEPLSASVDLLNIQGLHEDEIKVRLGTREDFKKLGLDRSFFLTSIQFDVEVDDSGRARIVLTTDEPVLEPYLDFIVEARWPTGRLLREYTVLIDPPAFSDATPVVSASERVEEVEGIPAPGKKKSAETSTGTRVELKKSELGPGEMPQRDFNAAAQGAPAPGGRYMVARDDTLWQIANAARPAGVSVHQTMLDIQRLNPDAFINNNINRVKAGYIIYLPGAEDISSGDLSAAMAEVRAQNEAWREGRDAELAAQSGPSLRISAEPEEAALAAAGDSAMPEPGSTPAMEPVDEAALESTDATERLAAMEHQVETLQRIVNLKDDQIAALQSALADAEEAGDVDAQPMDAQLAAPALDGMDGMDGETGMVADTADADAADADGSADEAADTGTPVAAAEPEEAPASQPGPRPKPAAPAESGGGIMDYLLYIAGAVVLALLGLFLWRRRGSEEEEAGESADVFSDMKLREQPLAVQEESSERLAADMEKAAPVSGTRGYGERRHDTYAADLEASDALAEADIYIAYGRHPQAIDLLNNALANEPDNPVYHLKLMEIHTELGDRGAAERELERIRQLGDPDALARGEALLAGLDVAAEEPQSKAPEAPRRPEPAQASPDGGPGLTPNPLDMMHEDDAKLESEFSGLEIEGAPARAGVEDELDLSADFNGAAGNADDEELLIAADSNGLSTKLDLARAYIDMGDDDGARQILEEIVAEGGDDLRAEAQALLDRIG